MPIKVKVTRDYVHKFSKSTKRLGSKRVMVGIPSSTAGRAGGSLNNATIGYIHEFGSPSENIPARPFLMAGINTAMPRLMILLQRCGVAAFEGKDAEANRLQNRIGIMAQIAVKQRIRTGPFAPLAPRTIADRVARGARPPFRPLIDTHQLIDSITYVIRNK